MKPQTTAIERTAPWLTCLILALSALGCGSDPATTPDASAVQCSFETCGGCCDGDRCVTDPDVTACGTRGSACSACSSGETCAAGQCLPIADCSDCDGCCLGGTQCVPGNSVAACGSGGEACVACGNGNGCDAETSTCQPTSCDATNCSGCCTANGVCLTYGEQTTAACGLAGAACGTCAAGASSCTQGSCAFDQPCLELCTDGCCTASGQCIPFSTQSASQCGGDTGAELCSACSGDLSCVEGGCVADVAWRVSIVSAVISPTKAGEEWDQTVFTNPLPDPYAGIALSGDTFLDGFTPTIDNTLTPFWNHAIGNYLESALLDQGLILVVRDSDGLGVFETIGTCVVNITMQHLAAGSLTRSCGLYASDVVISFTPPPST